MDAPPGEPGRPPTAYPRVTQIASPASAVTNTELGKVVKDLSFVAILVVLAIIIIVTVTVYLIIRFIGGFVEGESKKLSAADAHLSLMEEKRAADERARGGGRAVGSRGLRAAAARAVNELARRAPAPARAPYGARLAD